MGPARCPTRAEDRYMRSDSRLNKLMPALTAKERAILILRSFREQTPEDPHWRSTMPLEQSSQINQYICLMNACNIYIPLYITMVAQHCEKLWLRVYWMQSMIQSGRQIWELGKLIPLTKRAAAQQLVAGSYPVVELPWDAEEHEYSWLTILENMQEGLRVWLVSLWQELRSIDVVVNEVAEEFDGEDPLVPTMRRLVENTRRDLQLLHRAFDSYDPLELTEPDDEAMTLARKYFDNGYRLMRL